MRGLMQDWPLRVGRIIDHAARCHGPRAVIGRSIEGPVVRTDWASIRDRAARLTASLRRLGVRPGDVIGSMAWNTPRHLEVWYGVPGAGAVLHSLNPRQGADALAGIAADGGDAWLIADIDLAPLARAVAAALPGLRGLIWLTDAAHAPETPAPGDGAPGVAELLYEELIAPEAPAEWEPVDEAAACGICHTSGTTGRPKGVVYSHRSNVLHAMAMIQPDMLGLSCRDVLMPVVPLFHANGWSTGFSGPMAGSGMVLPGRRLDPASLLEMLDLGVTITAAVPSVWLPLLDHLRATGRGLPDLGRVVIGGSSCPRAVIDAFERDYGVQVLHAWGMTETSPLGSFASLKPEVAAMAPEDRLTVKESVGHAPFTVELALRDDAGGPVAADGATQGRLVIRGPGVVARYLNHETPATDAEGWFDTGDAATIDPLGYVRITDRLKDLIKSGGEWISSIQLENAALAHPGVAEAAAVGLPHPRWGERPVLVVVPRPGWTPDAAAVIEAIAPSVPRWQLPDRVIFAQSIPHTATGKISKLALRKRLTDEGVRLGDGDG